MKYFNLIIAAVYIILGSETLNGATPSISGMSVSWGSLEKIYLHSPELERDVRVDVLLPENYDKVNHRYPVIYMHDGQNLFDADSVNLHQAWEIDEAVERYAASGRVPPIIVGIWSSYNRMGDLMPVEPVKAIAGNYGVKELEDLMPWGLKGDCNADFIANTLKPEIDALYATLPDRDNTFIMGSSMGGMASWYTLCRHPHIFGGAGCLSTHWVAKFSPNEVFPSAFGAYLINNLPMDGQHKFYFDGGTVPYDEWYTPHLYRIMAMMEEMGYDESNLMYRIYQGHEHNGYSWASRVDIPLNFLLGNGESQESTYPPVLYMIGDVEKVDGVSITHSGALWSCGDNGRYTFDRVKIHAGDGSGNKGKFSFATLPGMKPEIINAGDRYGAAKYGIDFDTKLSDTVWLFEGGKNANKCYEWSISPGEYTIYVDLNMMRVEVMLYEDKGPKDINPDNFPKITFNRDGIVIPPPPTDDIETTTPSGYYFNSVGDKTLRR